MPTAKLGLASSSTSADDFVFDFSLNKDAVTRLAPNHQRRSYSNVYIPVPVALSEHSPEEWKATNPVHIPIEFEIYGGGQRSVEPELRKLRKFLKKDRRTGEPPDLVFQMGSKGWTVRLYTMDVTPTLWNDQGDESRVRVSLLLRTVKPED